MKRIFTKIISLLIICIVALSTVTFADQKPITVFLNGEQLAFDVEPTLESGRTLVPMRVIFEALGAKVDWDNDTFTAIAVKDDVTIKITIDDMKLYKNDEVIELDVPARLIDGRTLVPARAVSEGMGAKVDWNQESWKVDITTDVPEFSIGEVIGNTYTNKYIGIGAEFPENWTFSSEEEIRMINNITLDLLGDEYKEAVKNADYSYDAVIGDELGNSVNIVLENMNPYYEEIPYFISAKDYMEITIPSIEQALKDIEGIEFVSAEITETTFDGSPAYAVNTRYTLMGINAYAKQVCFRQGNHMAIITVSTISEDKTDEILSFFYYLK